MAKTGRKWEKGWDKEEIKVERMTKKLQKRDLMGI